MSKAKVIGGLLLATAVAIAGGVAEQFIGVSSAAMSGVVMLLSLLACYPAVKTWGAANRGLTFKRWALVVVVASISTATILLIVNRL